MASRSSGPGFRDALLLTISASFVLCGLFILPRARDTGIVTIAFFGACALVAGGNVARKLRYAKLQPLDAAIVGGVPIRQSRRKASLLGGGMLALALVLAEFGHDDPLVMWICVGAIGLTGGVLLGGVLLGWLPAGSALVFEPSGIVFKNRRYDYLVPWDAISAVAAGEFHDNAALLLWIGSLDAVTVEPPQHTARVRERLAANPRWVGAHVLLLPELYGLDLPLLVKAVERYVADPSTRAQLAERYLPPRGQARS